MTMTDWRAEYENMNAQRNALIVQCDKLRAELDVTRDLLKTAPAPDHRSEYEQWRGYVEDYLETI